MILAPREVFLEQSGEWGEGPLADFLTAIVFLWGSRVPGRCFLKLSPWRVFESTPKECPFERPY